MTGKGKVLLAYSGGLGEYSADQYTDLDLSLEHAN